MEISYKFRDIKLDSELNAALLLTRQENGDIASIPLNTNRTNNHCVGILSNTVQVICRKIK